VILTVLSAYVAFSFLSSEIIRFGIILGSLTIAYLTLILFIGKKAARWLPKELLVAIYYTAGIWIPILLLNDTVKSEVLIVAFIFFLLAFEDLLLLSFVEVERDRQQGSISLALVLGNKRTRLLLNSLSIIISISSALIILSAESSMLILAGLILLLMQFALSLVYHNSHRLRQNDCYRYLSEAVFFLPALMALLVK
jgi:4-hydroxybenzoate polyprenyltransferase